MGGGVEDVGGKIVDLELGLFGFIHEHGIFLDGGDFDDFIPVLFPHQLAILVDPGTRVIGLATHRIDGPIGELVPLVFELC